MLIRKNVDDDDKTNQHVFFSATVESQKLRVKVKVVWKVKVHKI